MRTSQDIGKSFEKTLESVFSSLQKTHAFRAHKLVDSHAAGNIVASQPSDYLIGAYQQLFYLEAKASSKNKRMTRSALQPAQRGAILNYGQVLQIPYYILFYSEVSGTVHILDGAKIMAGPRTIYPDALIDEVKILDLEFALIQRMKLKPLPEVLKQFTKNYGDTQ